MDCRRLGAYRLRRDQIGFTFALAFLSWFAPLTNLTELRDRVLGILLGVLVSSIVHLYLWPDSEAPQLKTRLAALYRRLADCLAAPKEAVPLAPLLVAFTDSEALIHRVRAEPLGTYAHPRPRAKGWPMRATLARPRRSPASAKATDSTPRRETRP